MPDLMPLVKDLHEMKDAIFAESAKKHPVVDALAQVANVGDMTEAEASAGKKITIIDANMEGEAVTPTQEVTNFGDFSSNEVFYNAGHFAQGVKLSKVEFEALKSIKSTSEALQFYKTQDLRFRKAAESAFKKLDQQLQSQKADTEIGVDSLEKIAGTETYKEIDPTTAPWWKGQTLTTSTSVADLKKPIHENSKTTEFEVQLDIFGEAFSDVNGELGLLLCGRNYFELAKTSMRAKDDFSVGANNMKIGNILLVKATHKDWNTKQNMAVGIGKGSLDFLFYRANLLLTDSNQVEKIPNTIAGLQFISWFAALVGCVNRQHTGIHTLEGVPKDSAI